MMFDRTFIIAELGVNHNGDLEIAKDLVSQAKQCGADAVKFQTFVSSELTTQNSELADYQKRNLQSNDSQYKMLKRLELSKDDHQVLFNFCKNKDIEFMSSPFDVNSAIFLAELGAQKIKIGSGELTNLELLNRIAKLGRTMIISSGMALVGEIELALGSIALGILDPKKRPTIRSVENAFIQNIGRAELSNSVALLHCTSDYPAKAEDLNLKAIETLRKQFGITVGYSDHSEGSVAAIAAVTMGANILEKHLTLDKNMDGPDHKASIEPSEFKSYVEHIRYIEMAMGDGFKRPSASERSTAKIARKSLVANKSIAIGDKFTEDNLTLKRPGIGIPAQFYWDYIGTNSDQNYKKDELIEDYGKFKKI